MLKVWGRLDWSGSVSPISPCPLKNVAIFFSRATCTHLQVALHSERCPPPLHLSVPRFVKVTWGASSHGNTFVVSVGPLSEEVRTRRSHSRQCALALPNIREWLPCLP